MNKTFKILLLLSLCFGGAVACEDMKPAELTTSDQLSNSDGSPIVPPKAEFNAADLQGTLTDGPFAGAMSIDFDKPSRTILVKIPTVIPVEVETTDIPQIPGGTVQVGADQTGSYAVLVTIPVEALLGRISFVNDGPFDPTKLPNGKALPGFPGGEPPGVTFIVPKIKQEVHLYFGVHVAAVFVATPQFDPRVSFTYPIKNKSKQAVIGYFSTVPAFQGFPGGLFHSIILPPALARALDDLF